jgi:hypothetical protein
MNDLQNLKEAYDQYVKEFNSKKTSEKPLSLTSYIISVYNEAEEILSDEVRDFIVDEIKTSLGWKKSPPALK